MSSEKEPEIVLGYWKLRGLVQPIRYLLQYTGIPYHEEFYEIGDAPEFSRKSWLDKKHTLHLDFPNLPYLIEKESKCGSILRLTQSRTILRHLGRRFGLAGSTSEQVSMCEMLLDQLHDLRMEFNIVCYNQPSDETFQAAKDKFCSQILPRYLLEFECFLNKWTRSWLVGDNLTIADFQFYEYLEHCWLMCDGTDSWEKYPRVRTLMKQIRNLSELKEYFESDLFHSLPINAKMAKFGGSVVIRKDCN